MRIVLSNIGTFGDINPLIAIALELKRRGHAPVMAVPGYYESRIRVLGLEFHAIRPDVDPKNSILVEMVYDVKKGTEHGLRDFLFPALRQTYDDLLDAATKPARADLLLLGELNYAGPLVAEKTGIPWASYVLAPLSFFSAFDPPVLPPFPGLPVLPAAPGLPVLPELPLADCPPPITPEQPAATPATSNPTRPSRMESFIFVCPSAGGTSEVEGRCCGPSSPHQTC